MDSKPYRIITALLWLALPVIGLQYWMVWDQLPARVASHFGAAGQPNGWMTRETSVIFSLALVAFLLATFTWALTRIRKPDALAWSLLAMFYVVMGVLVSVTSSVLDYNIHGRSLNIVPEMVVTFLAAFVVIAVALTAKRGPQLPRPAVVSHSESATEEVHASFLWAIVFAAMTAVELGLVAIIPIGGLRLVLVLPALLLGVTALAWSGFHYRFSSHGVEISTLGFRLRSIPLENIRAYAVAPWNPMGGYGIRGIGERRAYVWCNTGVRIMLSDGEVFLGHQNPKKIMNDLNAIRQSQKARETTRSHSF
jgi:uncharacterized membrane protein